MSDILFDCPQCGLHIAISDAAAGRQVTCPGCKKVISVPASSPKEEQLAAHPVEQEIERRQCPYCRETIRKDALKCRWCGSSMLPERAAVSDEPQQGFFSFERMITPEIIRIIYVIGIVLIAGVALMALFSRERGVAEGIIAAVLVLVVGNLLWRIYCELIIVIFSIHERLVQIQRKMK